MPSMVPPSSPSPVTLRQLSGAPTQPAPLSQSVVIVIDAQKEYTQGALPLSGIDQSIAALSQFLERARQEAAPIIHIVHIGKPGGQICNPEGPFVEIIDSVKPVAGETIIPKHFPSSFTQTTLESELSRIGRKDLIITGYMTHMCLNSTTRDAAESGYRCTIVSELTATRDLPDPRGGVIPAETIKTVHLAALADRFAIILEKAADLR